MLVAEVKIEKENGVSWLCFNGLRFSCYYKADHLWAVAKCYYDDVDLVTDIIGFYDTQESAKRDACKYIGAFKIKKKGEQV